MYNVGEWHSTFNNQHSTFNIQHSHCVISFYLHDKAVELRAVKHTFLLFVGDVGLEIE